MIPRRTQQLGGLLLLLVGGGFVAWTWQTALAQGYYYLHASLFFPAICVVGAGLVIFPGYKEERIARGEDIAELSGAQLLTPRWWGVLVLSLVAGAANWVLLNVQSAS